MTVFDRLRPAFAGFGAGCLIMAGGFLAIIFAGRDPMPAAVYGPDVTAVRSAAWAAAQITAATALTAGCVWRLPLLAASGAGLLGLLFTVLAAAMAGVFPTGAAVMCMCLGAAPLAYVVAFYAWEAARGRE